MSADKTSAIKSTETANKVRGMVKRAYLRAHEAKDRGMPVAYCMTVCLYDEILVAMDIAPVWTENYAALCAVKRAADPYLKKADIEGFSPLVCSYARVGIGFDILRNELGEMPPDAPDKGMPWPDMLLGSGAVCDPRYKWYEILAKYMDVPTFVHDVIIPPIDADLESVRSYYIRYQIDQLRRLVQFLERRTGRKLDNDKLNHIIDIAEETRHLWWQANEFRRAKPCPMPVEDHFNIFVPATFMIGIEETLDFYKGMFEELKSRVENKIGVIPEERYRLLWGGGLPPWHSMGLLNYFEERGAVFVAEATYKIPDPVEVPPATMDPLERIATIAFDRGVFRHQKARERSGSPEVEFLLEKIERFDIDGMVMHASKSCRATTMGEIHFRNLVQEQVGTPTMIFEGDIVDMQFHSEAQTEDRIDTFLEMLTPRM
jgi:benzoyl-CoA reductase/2-hydroxyglutaryl-CoA dehydratase subunit BcrC/BadD/HgdB